MFNPKMRVLMNVNATAQEWIEELQKLPPETPISICGAYNGYIHVETDENDHPTGVAIDCESLDEEYPEDAFDDDDEYVESPIGLTIAGIYNQLDRLTEQLQLDPDHIGHLAAELKRKEAESDD